jgi:hypothetical protein
MMPPAGRPRSSSLDRETRQQLDELDALMQRMLALPVELPEDLPSPPTPETAGEDIAEDTNAFSDASPGADVVTAPAAQPEGEQAGTSDLLSPTADPIPLTPPRERMESWGYSSPPPLAPVSSPFTGLDSPRTVEVKLAPSRAVTEKTRVPRVVWTVYPLLWTNWAFDQATSWLGPLGRWLRAPGGRALLGWGGLLLLAAALAWLAWDGMGWTW